MKLMVEQASVLNGSIVNESENDKAYYISGIFSTIGEKNINGRVYPKHIWESQVLEYQNEIKSNSSNTLMEYTHPAREYVDYEKSVAKITDLYIDESGKYVMGEAKLLNTPTANILKSLIDEGIAIGVSSRGVGEVQNGIVTDYKLITYDIVPNPSDYNAHTKGLNESFDNGILVGKSFMVDEKGLIVESKKDLENINKAENSISDDFRKLLSSF